MMRFGMVLAVLLWGGIAGWGQWVKPMVSEGNLRVDSVTLYGDGGSYDRLAFEGALTFRGESPGGFVVEAGGALGAGLVFRHELEAAARMGLWVYRSSSVPGRNGLLWDGLLDSWLEVLPERYEAEVVLAFEDGAAGSPVLGGLPLAAEVQVRDRESGDEYRQRFLVRHLEAKNKVLLLGLYSSAERFVVFKETLRQFGLRLYFSGDEGS